MSCINLRRDMEGKQPLHHAAYNDAAPVVDLLPPGCRTKDFNCTLTDIQVAALQSES